LLYEKRVNNYAIRCTFLPPMILSLVAKKIF
jgi:hypothetical protein